MMISPSRERRLYNGARVFQPAIDLSNLKNGGLENPPSEVATFLLEVDLQLPGFYALRNKKGSPARHGPRNISNAVSLIPWRGRFYYADNSH